MSRTARMTRFAALGTVAAVGLTACGAGASGEDEDVTLRFSWWGADTRHQLTQDVIDAFEEEHPDITVEGEFGSWDGYWDQLATQTAADDAPDIMQMDEQYIREYADRGALLALDDVDVSQVDESVVENGRIDGEMYGTTIGINSFVMVANPELFEEAGVEMPDDTTWTWDEYADLAVELSEDLDGAWGAGAPREPSGFTLWLRQHGAHLSGEDGGLGFEPADAEGYFQFYLDLLEEGGTPPAEAISEDQNIGKEQSLTGSGELALGTWWSNEAVALADAAGVEMELLRFPSPTGEAEDAAPWYKSSQFLSASAGTDHPEEAQEFIDFFANSTEAGQILKAERGLPPNSEVRSMVSEGMEGMQRSTADYIDAIEPEVGEPEPVTAAGGSEFGSILYRYQDEVFFGRRSPAEAAAAMHAEMEAELE